MSKPERRRADPFDQLTDPPTDQSATVAVGPSERSRGVPEALRQKLIEATDKVVAHLRQFGVDKDCAAALDAYRRDLPITLLDSTMARHGLDGGWLDRPGEVRHERVRQLLGVDPPIELMEDLRELALAWANLELADAPPQDILTPKQMSEAHFRRSAGEDARTVRAYFEARRSRGRPRPKRGEMGDISAMLQQKTGLAARTIRDIAKQVYGPAVRAKKPARTPSTPDSDRRSGLGWKASRPTHADDKP